MNDPLPNDPMFRRVGVGGRLLWIAALALALAFVATDSVIRIRGTAEIQDAFSGRPAPDPSSPTGYVLGQRALVMPVIGSDGYHWVMQTQAMLDGAGARIRRVDYDNAPDGREVHWSGSYRWWLAALAFADRAMSGAPLPIAVERVAPYSNALLFGVLLLVLTPLVARRFGAVPAAAVALTLACTRTIFAAFFVGNPDHHGLAHTTALLAVLFVIAGGAGWISTSGDGLPFASRLPLLAARRWFIASGIAGGIGLWVSAATIVPVLIGIGMGGIVATGWLARGVRPAADSQPVPGLWRTWGMSGAVTSLCFYVIEYAPSHFGWRLEVNHPLYALAWLGGGEIVHRASRALAGARATPATRHDGWMLAGAVVALAALPAVVVLAPHRTFWVADSFLWALHGDYISEFTTFASYWTVITWADRWENVSALPVVCVALVGALWRRATPADRAALVLGIPAGVIGVALAATQNRWWGLANSIWVAVLPGAVALALVRVRDVRTAFAKALLVAALAVIIVPCPLLTIRKWSQFGWRDEVEWEEVTGLVVRDVAQTLRARLGTTPGVVVAGPSSSTLLTFFGGMRTVGTLYWENLDGLRTTAAIYGARSPDEAHALITRHGVTHLVMFSWNFFAGEYALLSRGLREGARVPEDAFVWQMFLTRRVPPWLRPIEYQLPNEDSMRNQWVRIFEVVPDTTRAAR
jgi:hypothetical protein